MLFVTLIFVYILDIVMISQNNIIWYLLMLVYYEGTWLDRLWTSCHVLYLTHTQWETSAHSGAFAQAQELHKEAT